MEEEREEEREKKREEESCKEWVVTAGCGVCVSRREEAGRVTACARS